MQFSDGATGSEGWVPSITSSMPTNAQQENVAHRPCGRSHSLAGCELPPTLQTAGKRDCTVALCFFPRTPLEVIHHSCLVETWRKLVPGEMHIEVAVTSAFLTLPGRRELRVQLSKTVENYIKGKESHVLKSIIEPGVVACVCNPALEN